MRSVGFLLFCVVVCLVARTSQASVCLTQPPVIKKGGNCANSLNCQLGYYCNNVGQCAATLGLGQACLLVDGECGPSATCIGHACLANANPGDACGDPDNVNNTLPFCPTGCSNGVCIGGSLGDKCTYNSTTAVCSTFMNCTNSVCTYVPQPFCFGDTYCNPLTEYCYFSNYTCLPKGGAGALCTDSNGCLANFTCAQTSASASPTCIASGSVANDVYCSSNTVCQSHFCLNNYCVKEAKVYCTTSNQCSSNQICLCEGNVMLGGYGNCQENPCLTQTNNLMNCQTANCPTANILSSQTYNGSCLSTNCGQQLSAYVTCSPAHFIAPLLSLTIISLSFLMFFIVSL